MDFFPFLRYIIFCLLFIFALSAESSFKNPSFSFSFEKFEQNPHFDNEFALYGNSVVQDSTVRIFNKGRITCKKPIRFHGTNPGFSTNFTFTFHRGIGNTLEFFMVPKIYNKTKALSKFIVVKFGTDMNGSYAAISVGSEIFSTKLILDSDKKLYCSVVYNGLLKMFELRVSIVKHLKYSTSSLSFPLDVSNALWTEAMYVGISSSNENYTSVYSWSFEVKHGAPYTMHSEPLNPEDGLAHDDFPINERKKFQWNIFMALLVGAICGAFVASLMFIVRSEVAKRHPVAPVEYEEKNGKNVGA